MLCIYDVIFRGIQVRRNMGGASRSLHGETQALILCISHRCSWIILVIFFPPPLPSLSPPEIQSSNESSPESDVWRRERPPTALTLSLYSSYHHLFCIIQTSYSSPKIINSTFTTHFTHTQLIHPFLPNFPSCLFSPSTHTHPTTQKHSHTLSIIHTQEHQQRLQRPPRRIRPRRRPRQTQRRRTS